MKVVLTSNGAHPFKSLITFIRSSHHRLIHGYKISELNSGELVDTFIAVDKYLIDSLKNDLYAYFKANLDVSSAVTIFDHFQSKQIAIEAVKEVAKCVQSNCAVIFNDGLHIQLNESILVAILNMKWLDVSEIDVLKAISKWIVANLDRKGLVANRGNKQQAFYPFKPLVRFSDLTVNEVMEHKILIDDLLTEKEAYSLLCHLINDTVQLNIIYGGDRVSIVSWVSFDGEITTQPSDVIIPLFAHLKVNRKVFIMSIRTILTAKVKNFKLKVYKYVSGKYQETSDVIIKRSVVAGKWEIQFPSSLEITPNVWYCFGFEFTKTLSLTCDLFRMNVSKQGQGFCSLKSKCENPRNIEFSLATIDHQVYHCIDRVDFRYIF